MVISWSAWLYKKSKHIFTSQIFESITTYNIYLLMKDLKALLLKYSIQLSPDQWLGGECLGAYRQVRPLPPSSQFSFLHSWIGHLGNKGHAPACGRSGKDQTCWCQTSILAFVNSKGSQYLKLLKMSHYLHLLEWRSHPIPQTEMYIFVILKSIVIV